MLKKFILFLFAATVSYSAHADDKAFIATVYDTIVTKHLTPVDIEEIAIAGLKSISATDNNLVFSDGNDNIYLYSHRQIAGVWHKPQKKDDIKSWAEITSGIIDKAVKISPTARKNEIFMTENILYHATAALADHSKYRFSDEVEEDIESAKISARLDGNFLYIQILSFDNNTSEYVKNSILRYPAIKAVIIDLRGNKGGSLNIAIDIAKLFIDDGIIVTTKGKENDSTKYYIAQQDEAFSLPLAVLVDQNTASSAEALAAALHEQAQAALIGTQTFGKGTIQSIFAFDNGGKLALTTEEFFTPSGSKIQNIGIWPDYCIINDQLVDGPCTRQERAGNSTDIEFAKQVLSEQL